VWFSVDPIESIKQLAETYSFNQEQDGSIFDYKKLASIISSCNQQNNYDHRFTKVNTSGRAATNCASVSTRTAEPPLRGGYRGADIVLRPRSITTYQVQSVLSGYKLETAFINHLYNLYQNEPFVIPAELIYTDNVGTNPSPSGIDA
jgi:hypothetical protein